MKPCEKKRVRCATAIIAVAAAAGLTACNDNNDSADSGQSSLTSFNNHVTVTSGDLVGNARNDEGVISFKGIPYAAPPVGQLRWRAPQAVESWEGERQVKTFSDKCWAASAVPGSSIQAQNTSEDCLYLNVWTPANKADQKLPVMVWIHGGGFVFGTASQPRLDGTDLAQKGVIVVTLNYRLGVFGFLARPDLDAESGGHSSGDYGLEDQVAALQWVKKNIARFGGDPNNVTIFGESAGSHAVSLLEASPLAGGLFDKAIGESGAFWESEHGEMLTHRQALDKGIALGKKLDATTIGQLRKVPAKKLEQNTDWTFATDPALKTFTPSVDGYVLPENPYVAFMNGSQIDVPLLAGWNAAEGLPFFQRALPHDTPEDYKKAAATFVGQDNLSRFLQLYPGDSAYQAAQSAQTLIGDLVIRFPTWSWVEQQQQTGTAPVYVYNFDYTSKYNPVAAHSTDIPYVFGNFGQPEAFPGIGSKAPSDKDREVSNAIQNYWTNFAKTGDPNGPGLPYWPQYKGAYSNALRINQTIKAAPEEGTARFEFLKMFRKNGILTLDQQQ